MRKPSSIAAFSSGLQNALNPYIKGLIMKTDFKVYKRKIHVYFKNPDGLYYAWSTNAYRTCREAIAAAKEWRPEFSYVANFAKD